MRLQVRQPNFPLTFSLLCSWVSLSLKAYPRIPSRTSEYDQSIKPVHDAPSMHKSPDQRPSAANETFSLFYAATPHQNPAKTPIAVTPSRFTIMQPHLQFLVPILALLSFTTASPNPDPEPDPQAVAAAGGAVTTQAAEQAATVGYYASLYTAGGTTTVNYIQFTQTFASTALGTWALGATPAVGTIGLGSISGTVGSTKTKRALPSPELGSL